MKEGLAVMSALFIFISVIVAISWQKSVHDAVVMNNFYKTNYSTSDFFWAGDTIKDYLTKGQNSKLNIEAEIK